MPPAAGCCCFSGRVRYLVLVLITVSTSALFSNMILFNFTSLLHTNLDPDLKPVPNLDSLHEYTIWHDRRKRDVNETYKLQLAEGEKPVQQEAKSNSFNKAHSKSNDEGHPILPSTKAAPTTPTTTSKPQTKPTEKPRVVYITNFPTTETSTAAPTTPPSTTVLPTQAASSTVVRQLTTRNVVQEEVDRALQKLKDAEDKKGAIEEASEDDGDDKQDSGPQMASALPDYSKYFFRASTYAAAGIGMLCAQMPLVYLTEKFGMRTMFTTSMFLSAFAIAAMPFLVPYGFLAIFTLQFLLGMSFCCVFPLIGSVVASWATNKEQLLFLAFNFLFVYLGTVSSWPVVMVLHSNEVPLVSLYAIHALITAAIGILFLIFYREKPQQHPWIDGIELNKIVTGKEQDRNQRNRLLNPHLTVFKSASTWATWIASFGFFASLAVLTIFLPSFLSCQQVFLVDHLGWYAVLPFVFWPVVMFAGGFANMALRCCTSKRHVRGWNSFAFILSALLFIAFPIFFLIEHDNDQMRLYFLFGFYCPMAFIVSGFLKSVIMVGRGYARFMISHFSPFMGLAYMLVPYMINAFVVRNVFGEWSKCFFAISAIIFITAIVFALFGKGINFSKILRLAMKIKTRYLITNIL